MRYEARGPDPTGWLEARLTAGVTFRLFGK